MRPELERDASLQRSMVSEGDNNDDIDIAVKKYLEDQPDLQIEFQKIRKGWYLVKPINKKVFLKQAGKDRLVVRVGGGHVSMQKFLEDFVHSAT